MRKVTCIASAVALGACLWGWSGEARASDAIEIEGGGYIGYGTNPSHGPNPLGVGIGARAGVDFYNFYAGLAATYYFGASGECGGGAPNSGAGLSSLPSSFCSAVAGEVSLSQMTVLYGVDLGYTLTVPRARFLKFRPILELGDAQITRTGSVAMSDITTGPLAQYRSANSFYLQPGLEVFLTVSGFFVGADANLLLMPSVTDIDGASNNNDGTGNLLVSKRTLAAFTTHAQIGFRF
jgi:hypothetical protein